MGAPPYLHAEDPEEEEEARAEILAEAELLAQLSGVNVPRAAAGGEAAGAAGAAEEPASGNQQRSGEEAASDEVLEVAGRVERAGRLAGMEATMEKAEAIRPGHVLEVALSTAACHTAAVQEVKKVDEKTITCVVEWDDGDLSITNTIVLAGRQASRWELVEVPEPLVLRLGKRALKSLFRGGKAKALDLSDVGSLDCVLGPTGLILNHLYFTRDDTDQVPSHTFSLSCTFSYLLIPSHTFPYLPVPSHTFSYLLVS